METILNKLYDYNSVIFDIDNSEEWDKLNIPNNLIEKRNKIEYEIYNAILEYAIENKLTKKPVSIVVSNLHNEFFKLTDQLINRNYFITYLIFLLGKRTKDEKDLEEGLKGLEGREGLN